MISSAFRFHGHGSLRYVYNNGRAVRSPHMTIKAVKNTHRSKSRISVVVSKKVLKSAVGRNRIRRRLYEYIRLNLLKFNAVYDIVIITTSAELRDQHWVDIETQLDGLFQKAELYKTV